MSKKLILVFIGIIFFSSASLVKADVIINEVQIGGVSTNDEFIELYNSGDSSVDLTNWYINKKSSTGSESALVTKSHLENKSILSNSYFLLAKENGYAGNAIPDASWPNSYSLANNNSIILYRGSDIDKDQTSWENIEDGESTQKQADNSWKVCAPTTPGAINSSCEDDTPPDTGGGSSGGGSGSSTPNPTTPEPKPKVIENPTMKAKILVNALAFAGEPLKIKTNIFGYSNENVILGRVSWNFGDGGTFEQINNFEEFAHTYYYPGEYALFLEYYKNSFSTIPEVTNKMIIKVLATTVTISKVGDAKDFFIELSNNASSDINISNWVINAGGKTFVLPKNSVILSKKRMTISGKITGFSYGDQYNLKLFSSTGELVFDYLSSTTTTSFSKVAVSPKNAALKVAVTTPTVLINKDEQISTEDLQASVLNSNTLGQEKNSPYSSSIIPIASIVFIGTGAGAAYFIRRKKIVSKTGDDFEILDE